MQTHIIEVKVSDETLKRLDERARHIGQDRAEFAGKLIEKELAEPEAPKADKTFDEILAPIRQGFAETGMTEDELDQMFEEAREEVWQERQKANGTR